MNEIYGDQFRSCACTICGFLQDADTYIRSILQIAVLV